MLLLPNWPVHVYFPPICFFHNQNCNFSASTHLALHMLYTLPHKHTLHTYSYTDCNGSTCFQPVAVLSVGGENTSVSFFPGESREGLWEGTVPSDGTPMELENYPYLWLTITGYMFASLVILGAIVSMIFTVIFRKRK